MWCFTFQRELPVHVFLFQVSLRGRSAGCDVWWRRWRRWWYGLLLWWQRATLLNVAVTFLCFLLTFKEHYPYLRSLKFVPSWIRFTVVQLCKAWIVEALCAIDLLKEWAVLLKSSKELTSIVRSGDCETE